MEELHGEFPIADAFIEETRDLFCQIFFQQQEEEEFATSVGRATSFVGDFLDFDLSSVKIGFITKHIKNDVIKLAEMGFFEQVIAGQASGAYEQRLDAIIIGEISEGGSKNEESLRKIIRDSLLVHELTHASSRKPTRSQLPYKIENGILTLEPPYRIGMNLYRESIGIVFEEGFAEFVRMKYKEIYAHDLLCERYRLNNIEYPLEYKMSKETPGIPLPLKYVDENGARSVAVFGRLMELLFNQRPGLLQLAVCSRDSVEQMRNYIQHLQGINGLYSKVRSLSSQPKDVIIALQQIVACLNLDPNELFANGDEDSNRYWERRVPIIMS